MTSLPVNTFKQRLNAHERLVGLWVNFTHHAIAEALADSGFDWLLLDMEHAPNDLANLATQLLALRGMPATPIVRVPIHDMAWIKRALDTGAPNIMVPNVRTVEEAREAAEVSELEDLHRRLLGHAREVRGHLAAQLDEHQDYEAAADTVRRLMFIEKLQQEIDEALLALEN